MSKPNIYIIYGVSGSGKTTIGMKLAKQLGIPFYDADDFHPKENIAKMSSGIPLNDEDRKPWLLAIAEEIKKWYARSGAVLACSALKATYREHLTCIPSAHIHWIFLDGSFDLISKRLQHRANHFFNPGLLQSQFDALEKPDGGVSIGIDTTIENILSKIHSTLKTEKQQVGLIGLGTMGKNLAKNLLSKSFKVAVYNRQVKGKEVDFAKNFVQECKELPVQGFDEIVPFITSLQKPRTIILMVNAGKAVDMVIDQLTATLEPGDCIIDGGNSYYHDTIRREQELKDQEIHFVGAGISGGAKGALLGPSIMPGGTKEGYQLAKPFLESIAAKDKGQNPCCTHVGGDGSGHYIKMIHNGIEYAEMQLIAETYHFLRFGVGKKPEDIAAIFDTWRAKGKNSYLLEITANILRTKENEDYLLDKILDKAGQKGTGGWTITAALELGLPVSNLAEAVMARNLSFKKEERVSASAVYKTAITPIKDTPDLLKHLEKAFSITSICNHHMGFEIIAKASEEHNWDINLSEVARIWTNGCIIRSELMELLEQTFKNDPSKTVLLHPDIVNKVKPDINALTLIASKGLSSGCALPVFSAAANYILSYTAVQSSANMIQAQRDYFGAHTYQRVDQPSDQYFHTRWENQ